MATKNKPGTAEKAPKAKRETKPIPKGSTRTAQVWAMVERAEGASLVDIVTETGLKPHTARAILSIQRRKQGKKLELKDGLYRVAD